MDGGRNKIVQIVQRTVNISHFLDFGCTDKCKCKDGEKKVELEWEEGVATPSYCEYYCSATGHCGESDAYKGEINCYPCKNLDKTSISS